MTPLECYHKKVLDGYIAEDPVQLRVLNDLQQVFEGLITENQKRAGVFSYFRKNKSVTGAYLWGGVGIGKTLLMDCFFSSLPFEKKLRMHFYPFMKHLHSELILHQGEKNPLEVIAKNFAKKYIVLCFDEFFVSDITDAMLLGRFLKYLFTEGVTLVATSNVRPDDLYKNGLQRSQFLPAIAAIKANMRVINLPTEIDYRLRHLKEAGVFYSPLNELARENMEKSFTALANSKVEATPIEIAGREIKVKKRTDNIVWFDFADICKVPRSNQDYVEIAKKYHTVFISDIPIIPEDAKDTICLFIGLIDVLYDARVRLVLSAAEPVGEIYSRGYMLMEYTRTHSRLLEMQSQDYFAGEGG